MPNFVGTLAMPRLVQRFCLAEEIQSHAPSPSLVFCFLPVVDVNGSSAFLVFRAKQALIPALVQMYLIQDLVVRCYISIHVQVQSTYLQDLRTVRHSS